MKRTTPILLALVLTGCSSALSDDGIVLDGPFTDYFSYPHAELSVIPFSARSLHFEGTQFVLAFSVDCRQLPAEAPSLFELLQLPEGVNVAEWIAYHSADFLNEYSYIDPERHELVSGSIDLTDTKIIEKTGKRTFYYRMAAEELSFEGEIVVPSIATEEHSCTVPSDEEIEG